MTQQQAVYHDPLLCAVGSVLLITLIVSSLPAHDHVLLGMQISKRETFGKPVTYHSLYRAKHATIKNQLLLFLCAAPLLRSALK
jgi:hypothetical protein